MDTTPALFEHCKSVYDAMYHTADIGGDEIEGYPVWEGFLVKLITKDLNLSVPYYSTIMSALKQMDCVRQVKRGGGGAPSKWVLLTEPTQARFETMVKKKSLATTETTRKRDATAQALSDLNERLRRVEDLVLPN